MKIHAIATLMTAATVSFFQVKQPQEPAAPQPVAAAESLTEHRSTQWEVISDPSTGVRLMQDAGEEVKIEPFTDEEGGYNAGGVAQIVSGGLNMPATGAENDAPAEPADLADPTPTVPVDGVYEVTVAPIETSAVATTEGAPESAPAAEGTETPANDATMAEPAGTAIAGVEAPLDEAELNAPVEIDELKIPLPGTATGATGQETGTGGLAEKLVKQVSEAVGNESDAEGNGEPTMGEEDNGFWLRAAKLNDVFQYLARLGHKQYFHNADLDAANFVVTGHLGEGDPIEQMSELGMMYGITVHEKGNTVYAMTNAQLAQLPTKPFYYELKYLRPSDIDQIKGILQPVLTAGSGSVDYEQKTNTLIFIDNEQRIENIKEILSELDRPKQQIAIETRIMRIKSSSRNRIGVDWESVLGDGMTVEATEALNALFNLPDSDLVEQVITSSLSEETATGFSIINRGTPEETLTLGNLTGTQETSFLDETTRTINSNESHLVLSPLQLQATMRALNSGGLAQQESSPTLITEDNEAGLISIIDRIPIITTTISETDAGQNITEEVRYQVDANDPSASDDPTASREIGVSVAVTPTILPDNTIRMSLRPRSAQVVELIEGRSGNFYPRVNESTVDTIARVPNGYSLLIGGFYEEQESEDINKVPVLGDVPGLNFFFKSSDKLKEHTSLVFVVTPKLYEPVKIHEVDQINQELHDNHVLPNDHKWPDRDNPGFNYERNLGWTLGNAVKAYPPTPPSNPLHPDHPVNLPEWDVAQEAGIREGETMVEPVAAVPQQRKGLLGNLFKKRQH